MNGTIDVSMIAPPPTNTGFHKNCGLIAYQQKLGKKLDVNKFWPCDTAVTHILQFIFSGYNYYPLLFTLGIFYVGYLNLLLSFVNRLFQFILDIIFRILRYFTNPQSSIERKISQKFHKCPTSYTALVTGGCQVCFYVFAFSYFVSFFFVFCF